MLPHTDMCETCTKLRGTGDQDLLETHLLVVQKQTKFIKSELRRAKLSYSGSENDVLSQIAWIEADYAERKRLPKWSMQPKAFYFMSGFAVDILGIVDGLRYEQVNYLLFEAAWPEEKGINTVGSILFHRFTTHDNTNRHREAILFTDNCSSQFKCCYMVWFLAWWVIVAADFHSKNEIIVHHFNIAGHTKFGPDRGFALISRALNEENVFTANAFHDLVANRSSRVNTALNCSKVSFYNWKSILSRLFKKTVPQISQMHHFQYLAADPGVVYFKKTCDDEWNKQLLFAPGVTVENIRASAKNLSADHLPNAQFSEQRLRNIKQILDSYGQLIGTAEEYTTCTM